ncbi:MAG: hypothetical protein JWM68_1494 [Verrucomicrobiales bacterium]|nr:hypothetical protein [Verrucomicrobiales bacterium]
MKQDSIKSVPELLGSAAVIKAAAVVKGPGIPLLQNTAINIGLDADALTTARNIHEQSKVVLATNRSLLATIIVTVRAFLTLGRDLMKPIFGGDYSQAFDVLGLIGSLMIPSTTEELLVLLQAFKAFYLANPDMEDESRNITAAQAQVLYDQLVAAQAAVNVQVTEVRTRIESRDTAATKLRKRLRGVFDEMRQAIDPMDPRWLAFGFKMPGAVQTPDVVEGLIAVLIGPGTSALKWNAPARAEYYRVWMRVVGVDAEAEAVGSPADIDFNLENLPANATIELSVSAVNDGGEGQRSDVVTIVTH